MDSYQNTQHYKNFLICASDLNVGGIQKSLIKILKLLNHKNCHVDLMLKNVSSANSINLPNNVNLIESRKIYDKFSYFPINLKNNNYKYAKEVKSEYDIAIDFDGYQILSALTIGKVKAHKKIIWVHSDYYNRYKNNIKFKLLWMFTKQKYDLFTDIVYVSKYAKKQFHKLYNAKLTLNEHVIPNIVDTETIFNKADKFTPEIEKYNQSDYNLCYLGRLAEEKRLDLLLKIFTKVLVYRKTIKLYIIGDGPKYDKLKEMIDSKDLDSHVILLGYKSNPYAYLKMMDGLILVSQYEGQGIVLQEARALGLDIFISNNLKELSVSEDTYVGNLVETLKEIEKTNNNRDNLSTYNSYILRKLINLLNI